MFCSLAYCLPFPWELGLSSFFWNSRKDPGTYELLKHVCRMTTGRNARCSFPHFFRILTRIPPPPTGPPQKKGRGRPCHPCESQAHLWELPFTHYKKIQPKSSDLNFRGGRLRSEGTKSSDKKTGHERSNTKAMAHAHSEPKPIPVVSGGTQGNVEFSRRVAASSHSGPHSYQKAVSVPTTRAFCYL